MRRDWQLFETHFDGWTALTTAEAMLTGHKQAPKIKATQFSSVQLIIFPFISWFLLFLYRSFTFNLHARINETLTRKSLRQKQRLGKYHFSQC